MSVALLAAFADWAFHTLAAVWDWFWALPVADRWPPEYRRLIVSFAAFAWSFLVGWVQTRVVRAVLTTTKKTETTSEVVKTITTRKTQLAPDWTQWNADIALGTSAVALLLTVSAAGFGCQDQFASVRLGTFLTVYALGTGALGIIRVIWAVKCGVVHRRWWSTWPLTLMVLAGFFLALMDIAASLADYQVPWSCAA